MGQLGTESGSASSATATVPAWTTNGVSSTTATVVGAVVEEATGDGRGGGGGGRGADGCCCVTGVVHTATSSLAVDAAMASAESGTTTAVEVEMPAARVGVEMSTAGVGVGIPTAAEDCGDGVLGPPLLTVPTVRVAGGAAEDWAGPRPESVLEDAAVAATACGGGGGLPPTVAASLRA